MTSIAPGESVLFLETAEGLTAQEEGEVVTKFETSWFGSSVPAGLQVGTYNGSGVGLSRAATRSTSSTPKATTSPGSASAPTAPNRQS